MTTWSDYVESRQYCLRVDQTSSSVVVPWLWAQSAASNKQPIPGLRVGDIYRWSGIDQERVGSERGYVFYHIFCTPQ